jgi:hypothetical protein
MTGAPFRSNFRAGPAFDAADPNPPQSFCHPRAARRAPVGKRAYEHRYRTRQPRGIMAGADDLMSSRRNMGAPSM